MSSKRLLPKGAAARNPNSGRYGTRLHQFLLEGDRLVGKSSIVRAYQSVYRQNATLSTDKELLTIKLEETWIFDGTECIVTVHEYQPAILGKYVKRTYNMFEGFLLTFALDDRKSFDNLTEWRSKLLTHLPSELQPGYPLVVLANKCDVPESARCVTRDEIERWCNHYDAWYYETSERKCDADAMKRALEEILRKKRLFDVKLDRSLRADDPRGPIEWNPIGSDGEERDLVVYYGGIGPSSAVASARPVDPFACENLLDSDYPLITGDSDSPRRGCFCCCC